MNNKLQYFSDFLYLVTVLINRNRCEEVKI